MYENLGKGLEALYHFVIILLVTAVPLALWKLADMMVWLFNHVEITWRAFG